MVNFEREIVNSILSSNNEKLKLCLHSFDGNRNNYLPLARSIRKEKKDLLDRDVKNPLFMFI